MYKNYWVYTVDKQSGEAIRYFVVADNAQNAVDIARDCNDDEDEVLGVFVENESCIVVAEEEWC